MDVDDDLLARAQADLGTATAEETINEALRVIAERVERTAQNLARLGIGQDAGDPEIMRGARR
ncbi:hypothetical protein GCM10010466_65640 [Planomonospora alba]|uniref:Uncharacterized protein n=1 Tax=Planomonospora alba TaxID=161354 RepID=A0ABP6P309_9ACTN